VACQRDFFLSFLFFTITGVSFMMPAEVFFFNLVAPGANLAMLKLFVGWLVGDED